LLYEIYGTLQGDNVRSLVLSQGTVALVERPFIDMALVVSVSCMNGYDRALAFLADRCSADELEKKLPVHRFFLRPESASYWDSEVGVTPLLMGAWAGSATCTKFIIARRSHLSSSQLDNALLLAASNGFSDVVDLLLAANANVHYCTDSALRSAVRRTPVGLPPRDDIRDSFSVQHVFSVHANAPAVQSLWSVAPRRVDPIRDRPPVRNYEAVVKSLLHAQADVRSCEDEALRKAVCSGLEDTVVSLLGAGANVHACESQPLRCACRARQRRYGITLDSGWCYAER